MKLDYVREFLRKSRPKCALCHRRIHHGEKTIETWKGVCHVACVEYTPRR